MATPTPSPAEIAASLKPAGERLLRRVAESGGEKRFLGGNPRGGGELWDKGLAKGYTKPNDREREVRVVLTPLGRAVAAELEPAPRKG